MRDKIHPASFRNRIEAWPDAANDLAKLLDRIPVQGLCFGAVAEEQLRRLDPDAHHHDADADIGDGVVGVLHVDAQIRPHAAAQQRPGPGTAELVRDHRTQQDVALEPCAGANDGLDAAEGSGDAAFVVVGAHAPNPAVLELGAIGVD